MRKKIIKTSMLLFIFLLYFQNGFTSTGYSIHDDRSSSSITLKNIEKTKIGLQAKTESMSINNMPLKSIKNLDFFNIMISECLYRVQIKDSHNKRYEIPDHIYSNYENEEFNCPKFNPLPLLKKSQNEYILQKPDLTNLVVLDIYNIIYSDLYIEFNLIFDNNIFFGLGERITNIQLKNWTYTIFNKDQQSPIEDGKGGNNIYGSQPFLISKTKNNEFVGIYLRNSNYMDIIINNKMIKFKTTGGIIDLYIFYHQKVEALIQNYHTIIGRPYLPPFWSFGYHQSRWGYTSTNQLREVVNQFKLNDIPLDVIWNDIDVLSKFKIFSVDTYNFPNLFSTIETFHDQDIRYVPIVDAGIVVDHSNKFFNSIECSCIRSSVTKLPVVGSVWGGKSVFPDFLNPNTSSIWQEGMKDFLLLANYDGIWLDMNEVANLQFGESILANFHDCNRLEIEPSDLSKYENPSSKMPYIPGGVDIETMTIPASSFHYSKTQDEADLNFEYNSHNLFSFYQTKSTFEYLKKAHKRPFVLTRANMPGVGKYSSHWTGDNKAGWDYLRYSVGGMINFQLFGIPHVGADICGFFDNPNDELCARWFQVGLFYPFSRQHSHNQARLKEPYSFSKMVQDTARSAIRLKYSLSYLYYSLHYYVHKNGGTVLRPLHFEFPEDNLSLHEIDNHFMIGNSLFVLPAMEQNMNKIKVHLPQEDWYDFFSGEIILKKDDIDRSKTFTAHYNVTNILLRGGNIVPILDSKGVNRIMQMKNQEMSIIIGLNNKNEAYGKFIVDLSEDNQENIDEFLREYEIQFKNQVLSFHVKGNRLLPQLKSECVTSIKIYSLNSFSFSSLLSSNEFLNKNNQWKKEVKGSSNNILVLHSANNSCIPLAEIMFVQFNEFN